jgi:hypothetical protein
MLITDGRSTITKTVTDTPTTLVTIAKTLAMDLSVERPTPSEGGGMEGDVTEKP